MLNAPIKLATPILLNLIRRRGGEPHPTLSSVPTWYDEGAQRTIDQEVNALLTQHGLLGPRGMDRGLLDAVESISRPQVEYYGWFEGEFPSAPRNFAVLAGSGAGGAFVLVRIIGEDAVLLAPERPEEMLSGFVNQIPVARPATGQPLITTKAEFLAGRDARADGEYTVMRSGRDTTPAPAKEMKRIMEAPRTGAGTLYVAARTRSGARRRCERPLNFVDTVEGRWLMEERPGRDDALVVFTPASPQVLSERLRNAHSALG
ncbi:ESX secretion-associated protein EspG [Amycolatopsis pithecellobii]|uniref:ESX secretion-associated protein EspG n=1 Tax=Amycolatopsis pithecellobii TaxID=664692 RepID=A0A6N7YT31_9PSEU|nr:ESX secretion-associated protein EspG [Amycolatopsis pithecellobii]MTD56185.1 ESX secretion-associated protein EspG [Amycolatopsis pithecellobii]